VEGRVGTEMSRGGAGLNASRTHARARRNSPDLAPCTRGASVRFGGARKRDGGRGRGEESTVG
jgi:hypothetical protein